MHSPKGVVAGLRIVIARRLRWTLGARPRAGPYRGAWSLGSAVTEPASPVERAVLDTSVVIADQRAPIPGVLAISTITLAG